MEVLIPSVSVVGLLEGSGEPQWISDASARRLVDRFWRSQKGTLRLNFVSCNKKQGIYLAIVGFTHQLRLNRGTV